MMQHRSSLAGIVSDDIPAIPGAERLTPVQYARVLYWFYRKRTLDFDKMPDIPKPFRKVLSNLYIPGWYKPVHVHRDSSGTEKYIFPVSAGGHVETVIIPDGKRNTICISVQSGCRMGCSFCHTGTLPFRGNLTAGEIVNQFYSIPGSESITHVVIMGMGEAFDNPVELNRALRIFQADWGFGFSPARITVSTVGIMPGMAAFLNQFQCHLAFSLHSPFPKERQNWIPAERKYPLQEVIKMLSVYSGHRKRRISVEYAMISGVNDTLQHLAAIIQLLRNTGLRVNIIPFNPVPHLPWQCSEQTIMIHFRDELNAAGIACTIRKSRGRDIGAACGMLGGQ